MRLIVLAVTACVAQLGAAVDFAREVYPVLERSCFGCHGSKLQMARLRLDSRAGVFAGGQSGAVVKSGRSAESLLVSRITATNGMTIMPPAGARLTDEEIGRIRAWIDEGATWPDGVGAAGAAIARHWAYVAPVRPAPPEPRRTGWAAGPLDKFVLARLERESLTPSAAASKETILRRISLDLTGLPPTLKEIDEFLADNSPGAYERQVDRLLFSPHFGERWASWWLDLARYADTNGYESDEPRSMWPWRDWVIQAFNRNLPFDRFTIEQIAGDLLPDATEQQRIATGFHRNTLVNSEAGSKDDEFRDAAVKDRVETTATVWLGTTIGCAQCHNHKYDPFTQKDYYRLYAFFNSTAESAIELNEELRLYFGDRAELDRRRAALDEARKVLDTSTPELAAAQKSWEAKITPLIENPTAAWRTLGTASGEKEEFQPTLEGPVTAVRVEPATRAEVEFWTRRDLARQEELIASHPEFGDWHQIGPFEEETPDEAHAKIYPPEQGVDLAAAHLGLAWRKRSDLPDGDWYQLDGYNCVTYLYRTITAKQAQRIRVGIGSAQGIQAWLNGSKIVGTGPLEALPVEKGVVDLDLRTGVNHLLLKYTNGPGYYRYYFKKFIGLERERTVRLAGPATPNAAAVKGRLLDRPAEAEVIRVRFPGKPKQPVRVDVSSQDSAELASWIGLPASVEKALTRPETGRTSQERDEIASHFRWNSAELASARKQHDELKKEFDAFYERNSAATLVMRELPEARETHIQARGNFLTRGELVTPGVPAIFPQIGQAGKTGRLALAQWLMRRDNPLTARVVVNHFWRALFGTGLVKTGEDFGSQGDRPVHPELLDWLAVEFAENGWDVKALLKTIVTSSTYRQSSAASPELLTKDPENKLFARGSRFRLPAESVRDATLTASGLLSRKIGGPSVFPPLPKSVFENLFIEGGLQTWKTSEGDDRHRRGMYTFYKRTAVYPTYMTFDAPERNVCVVDRPRSNTPLQALTTLNDEVFVEAARALAARLLTELPSGATDQQRIEHGFRLVTGRRPSAKETASVEGLLAGAAARYKLDAQAAAKLAGPGLAPNLAAWVVVSNILLNLDEAVTKE